VETRYVGQWWLPQDDTRTVPGELTLIKGEPARLDLQAPLSDGLPATRLPVVLGTSARGEVVTLTDVTSHGISRTNTRKLDHEVLRETLRPGAVFVGAHLPAPDDRLFNEAVLDLTDLIGWAGTNSIREQYGVDGADVSISIDPQPVLASDLPMGRIELTHGWGTDGDGVQSRTLERSVGFFVKAVAPLGLDSWLSEFVGPLRNLLTFATELPNEVTELQFKSPRYDENYGTWVEVWYPRGHTDREPAIHGFDFLVDAPRLGDEFGPFLKRWFGMHGKLASVFPLLLGPRYRPDTFMDNHFLNTAGAAEGYHRILYRNEMLPKAAHKQRLSSIMECAPNEHRAWLREALAHSNEPTFRDRLRELHDRSFNVVAGVVGSADDFAGPVVKLRNALTHRGKGTPKAVPSGVEMFRLMQTIRFVMDACVLLDLGLDEMTVVDSTRRSTSFRWINELEVRQRMTGASSL
jgi:hypothetical protein